MNYKEGILISVLELTDISLINLMNFVNKIL